MFMLAFRDDNIFGETIFLSNCGRVTYDMQGLFLTDRVRM